MFCVKIDYRAEQKMCRHAEHESHTSKNKCPFASTSLLGGSSQPRGAGMAHLTVYSCFLETRWRPLGSTGVKSPSYRAYKMESYPQTCTKEY